jgi:GPR1/FUN34/yaaH family
LHLPPLERYWWLTTVKAWFIFTTLLLLCTLRSTLAFFLLFFTLDIAFLTLAIGHFYPSNGAPSTPWIKAGGFFGLLAAFLAWYNAFAGMADKSNLSVPQSFMFILSIGRRQHTDCILASSPHGSCISLGPRRLERRRRTELLYRCTGKSEMRNRGGRELAHIVRGDLFLLYITRHRDGSNRS